MEERDCAITRRAFVGTTAAATTFAALGVTSAPLFEHVIPEAVAAETGCCLDVLRNELCWLLQP